MREEFNAIKVVFSRPTFLSKVFVTLSDSGGIRPGIGKTEILAVLCHGAVYKFLVCLCFIH